MPVHFVFADRYNPVSYDLQTLSKTERALDATVPFKTINSEEYFQGRKLLGDYMVYNSIQEINPDAHRAIMAHYFPRSTQENSTVNQRVNRAMNISVRALTTGSIPYPEELELRELLEDPEVDKGVQTRDKMGYKRIKTMYSGGVKSTWQLTFEGGPPRSGDDPSYGFTGTITTRYESDSSGGERNFSSTIQVPPIDLIKSSITGTLRNICSRLYRSGPSEQVEEDRAELKTDLEKQ